VRELEGKVWSICGLQFIQSEREPEKNLFFNLSELVLLTFKVDFD
jgi:hypothetical protein